MIPPVKFIGLVAKKYRGKDTFYALALELHLEKRIKFRPRRIAFADALKREVAEKHNVSIDDINKNKDKYRKELQDVGVAKRKEKESYWIDKVAEHMNSIKIKEPTLFIFTDVRFQNEAQFVRDYDGYLIKIRRAGVGEEDKHISEVELESIVCDNFIDNNSSERLFKMQILDLLKQLNIT